MVENGSVASHSTMVWAESIKWAVKTSAIVHGSVRDDVEEQWEKQQQNEEHQQMKIQQKNENQKWNEDQKWNEEQT